MRTARELNWSQAENNVVWWMTADVGYFNLGLLFDEVPFYSPLAKIPDLESRQEFTVNKISVNSFNMMKIWVLSPAEELPGSRLREYNGKRRL